MRRTLLVLAAAAALALALRGIRLEEDPVHSLAHPDPIRAQVFDRYQAQGLFRDLIFVEAEDLAAPDAQALAAGLREAGYAEAPLFERPSPETVLRLAPLLPPDEVERLMGEDALRRRAGEAASVALLPGGDAVLEELERDPLGLGPALLTRMAGAPSGGGPAVRAYRSPRPLVYDRIGKLYDQLVRLGPRVHFIGGDFFALENYRAARHDILVCTAVSLLLNLLLFHAFTGRRVLLALLLVGSAISYLCGLVAIRAFFGEVFAVVLAYTSTFVGFNTESVVYLSAIDPRRKREALLGVGSALGTTLIGFLLLLTGRTVMIRQMAVASLAGLLGFLGFLALYPRLLASVRFRTFRWPGLALSGRSLVVLCLAAAGVVALAGVPAVATHVDAFRFQTPVLDRQVAHFSRKLDSLSLEDVVAFPAQGSAEEALSGLATQGLVDPARHPLARLPPRAEQEATLRALSGYGQAVARLVALLEEEGIRIAPAPRLPPAVAPLDGWHYLELLGTLGPVRWTDEVGGRRWLMAGLEPGAAGRDLGAAVAVSPRHHYDALLTTLSRELGLLFLAGLVAMAAFLAILQRRAVRVLYVFAPLFLAAAAFAVWARLTASSIHIVHLMGFSLIIAVGTDYTAVAVSGGHGPVERSKVLVAGLSALATFGSLLLARHPVLRELGATVAAGCAISVAFALLVPLRQGAGEGG